MAFTQRKKALALTGLIGGQERRNISEKGILDTGVRARGREQNTGQREKKLGCHQVYVGTQPTYQPIVSFPSGKRRRTKPLHQVSHLGALGGFDIPFR